MEHFSITAVRDRAIAFLGATLRGQPSWPDAQPAVFGMCSDAVVTAEKQTLLGKVADRSEP